MDSPLSREVAYKKALFYNRKASEDKTLVVGRKPIRIVKASEVAPGTNSQDEKTEKVRVVYVTVPAANGTTSTVSSSQPSSSSVKSKRRQPTQLHGPPPPIPQGKVNRKSTSSEITPDKETPANDRVFFPPYKFPFWGLPYGIYSNAGFINPGLFPFVPGGEYLTKCFKN